MEPGTTCGDIKAKVEAKIEDVEQKIEALQQINKALLNLVKKCTEKGPVFGGFAYERSYLLLFWIHQRRHPVGFHKARRIDNYRKNQS